MNFDKADIKIGTMLEIGTRLEDMFEAAGKDMHRLEGSVTALRAVAVSLEGLNKHIDQDIEGGHMELSTANHVKKYVARAHQIALNMAQNAENNRWIQQGKVQGMDAAVQAVKKTKDNEQARAEALRAALEAKLQEEALKAKLQEEEAVKQAALEAQEKEQADLEVLESRSKRKKKNG